jgi:hypothetical protein
MLCCYESDVNERDMSFHSCTSAASFEQVTANIMDQSDVMSLALLRDVAEGHFIAS